MNRLLDDLEISKIDPKILAKIVGKDRTTEQATRSEKRAASLGVPFFPAHERNGHGFLGYPAISSQAAPWAQWQHCD